MVHTLMNYGGVLVKYKLNRAHTCNPQVFHYLVGTKMLNPTHLHLKTSNLQTNFCVLSFEAEFPQSYAEWTFSIVFRSSSKAFH